MQNVCSQTYTMTDKFNINRIYFTAPQVLYDIILDCHINGNYVTQSFKMFLKYRDNSDQNNSTKDNRKFQVYGKVLCLSLTLTPSRFICIKMKFEWIQFICDDVNTNAIQRKNNEY